MVYKRGGIWYYEFVYSGRRFRGSARTTRKTVALEVEQKRKRDLERQANGLPVEKPNRQPLKTVSDVIKPYLEHYAATRRPASFATAKGALGSVQRRLGAVLVTDLSEAKIRAYMQQRKADGVSGRTINIELAELSPAIGRKWSALWPSVRRLEERSDVGRALTREEEARLLAAVDAKAKRSPNLPVILRAALLTGLRAGELMNLTWGQVDFEARVLTVGKAKTAAGQGRQIPFGPALLRVLSDHAAWYAERFGDIRPAWYVFAFGVTVPTDPTRPTVEIKTCWTSIRKAAGVWCRLHDLRHTFCTKLAEAGVPESTMLALMGHMSRAMLERYSHVRMEAKRKAIDAITLPGEMGSPHHVPPPPESPVPATNRKLLN